MVTTFIIKYMRAHDQSYLLKYDTKLFDIIIIVLVFSFHVSVILADTRTFLEESVKIGQRLRVVAVASFATLTVIGCSLDSVDKEMTTPVTIAVRSVSFTTPAIGGIIPVIKWHWWGREIFFSKRQTEAIAVIASGTVSPIAGFGWASGALATATFAAQTATDNGYCLKANQPYVGQAIFTPYKCSVNNGLVSKPG